VNRAVAAGAGLLLGLRLLGMVSVLIASL